MDLSLEQDILIKEHRHKHHILPKTLLTIMTDSLKLERVYRSFSRDGGRFTGASPFPYILYIYFRMKSETKSAEENKKIGVCVSSLQPKNGGRLQPRE